MDSDNKIRKNIKYGNSPNDPGTEGQKKYLRDLGENPSQYKDNKSELTDAIRDAKKGNLSGKISNDIRKIRKWNDDGF
tara:strand:+ start:97 stop:330 length:234 start_codon:yes stop_codon:yes gene_type:complete